MRDSILDSRRESRRAAFSGKRWLPPFEAKDSNGVASPNRQIEREQAFSLPRCLRALGTLYLAITGLYRLLKLGPDFGRRIGNSPVAVCLEINLQPSPFDKLRAGSAGLSG